MKKKGAVVGVTWGDPAGVGPELARQVFKKVGRSLSLRQVGHSESRPGRPSLAGARLAKESLAESVRLFRSGEIQAVVNGPVSKEWLEKWDFVFQARPSFMQKLSE